MGFFRTARSAIRHCRSVDRGSSWFLLVGEHHHHADGAIWSFIRVTGFADEIIATTWTTGSHWLTGKMTRLPDDPANARLLISKGSDNYAKVAEAVDQLVGIPEPASDSGFSSCLIYLRHPNRTDLWTWSSYPSELSRETVRKISGIRWVMWKLFDYNSSPLQ